MASSSFHCFSNHDEDPDMRQPNQNTEKQMLQSVNHLNIYRLKSSLKKPDYFQDFCLLTYNFIPWKNKQLFSCVLVRLFSRLHDWKVMFVAVGGVQCSLCFGPVHAGEGNTQVDGTAKKKRKQKDVCPAGRTGFFTFLRPLYAPRAHSTLVRPK